MYSVGAFPALAFQAASLSLPPSFPPFFSFSHLPFIYSFIQQLFIECLLFQVQETKQPHVETGVIHLESVHWKHVCSKPSLFSLPTIDPCRLFHVWDRKKLCQEFISVHLWGLCTHTHLYITFAAALSWEPLFWPLGMRLACEWKSSYGTPPACTFVCREILLGELPQEPLSALLIIAAYFSH